MVRFEEMTPRLKALGLKPAWLAKESGRALQSIYCALAPNAAARYRSEFLQRALSEAIEREESARAVGASAGREIVLTGNAFTVSRSGDGLRISVLDSSNADVLALADVEWRLK